MKLNRYEYVLFLVFIFFTVLPACTKKYQLLPSSTVSFSPTATVNDTNVIITMTATSTPTSTAINTIIATATLSPTPLCVSASYVTTLAGISGVSGADNGPALTSTFNGPEGIAVNSAGNIFVSDNAAIREITTSGMVSTFAGQVGIPGSTNGVGTAAQFWTPEGIAVDAAGNIYVAEDLPSRIRKISSGALVSNFAGGAGVFQDGMGTTAGFYNPRGVAVDSSGNIFVADENNNRIRMITPAGLVSTFAGTGNVGASNGPVTSATFHGPFHVAVDSSGNVYVADVFNDLIRKISTSGMVSTLAGSGSAGSADGMGTLASFGQPSGIAVDSNGNVYVADAPNKKIRKISPTGLVTTLAGTGLSGSTDGPGCEATFSLPGDVAVDSSGNVYVADTGNHTIRKIQQY